MAKIAFLSLSVAPSGLKTMMNFSFKHNLHDFVVGLKIVAFEMIIGHGSKNERISI